MSEEITMRERLMISGVMWLGLSLPLLPSATRAQAPSGSALKEHAPPKAASKTGLRMTPGVVCRAIRGFEDYDVLPKAAQTSDEKLLVYFRPLGFQSELVDGAYQAYLYPDFEIRKRGEKEVLLRKRKMFEYKPRYPQPPRLLYMKNTISLKGLPPGDYDLTMILHDEVAKGTTATQVIRFKVIPPVDLRKKEKASSSDDEPASH